MASKSNLAPSRDALRALRSLAFSPHTALVGAVGSCCALAAVHYHEYRQLRTAERLLERKRALHTISQGRGPARIARMFEAAERGDDFTLHHGRPRKSQKRRTISSRAHERSDDEVHPLDAAKFLLSVGEGSTPLRNSNVHTETVDNFDYPLRSAASPYDDSSIRAQSRFDPDSTSSRPPADYMIRGEDPDSNLTEQGFKPFDQPPSRTNNLENEKAVPRNTSSRSFVPEHEHQNHLRDALQEWRTFQIDQSRRSSESPSIPMNGGSRWTWRTYRDRALRVKEGELLKSRWVKSPQTLTLEGKRLMQEENPDAPGQTLSDLSLPIKPPVEVTPGDNPTGSIMSAEESIFFNFVYGKPASEGKFATNAFQPIHPWQHNQTPVDKHVENDSTGSGAVEHDPASPSGNNSGSGQLPITIPYLRASDKIPERSGLPAVRLRYFQTSADNVDLLKKVNPQRFKYVLDSIANVQKEHGSPTASLLLQDTAQKYAESGDPSDLLLAQSLLQEFRHHMPGPDLGMIRNRIVHNILNSDTPRREAVLLLYPSLDHRDGQRLPLRYADPAMQYMQQICDSDPSFPNQMKQLEKILQATRDCGIPIDERLVLPVIRTAIEEGEVVHAQSCYDHVAKHFQVVTLDTCYREVVRGYAQLGNWWKVKMMFKFPPPGRSASEKIQGFASMFSHTMDQFAAKNSIEKLCAYVMQGIELAGLFPTSQITRKLVGHCVKNRRYDLIEQYLDMLRRDFSSLEHGTNTSPFALEMASAWREMGASCEDVYRTCLALWTISVHDPFSKVLRSMASAIVTRDVVLKVRALEDMGDFKIPDLDQQLEVDDMAYHVRMLVKHHHELGFSDETRSLAKELVATTRIMIELDQLFSGTKRHIPSSVLAAVQSDPYSQKHDQDFQHAGGKLPQSLRAYRLPASPVEIVSLLETYYTENISRQLNIDHSGLKFVASRLASVHRDYDCYEVLNAIYSSKWVQSPIGTPFDLDLFLKWLDSASAIRSAPRLRKVLWAVIDSDAELQVTTELLLKARVAIPRVSLSKTTSIRKSAVAENEYLSYRIKRRIYEQQLKVKGRPNQIRFKEWTCSQARDLYAQH